MMMRKSPLASTVLVASALLCIGAGCGDQTGLLVVDESSSSDGTDSSGTANGTGDNGGSPSGTGTGNGTGSGTGSGSGGNGTTTGSGAGTPVDGLGPWTGNDNVPPSEDPPSQLSPQQVPMLVALGFDDNSYSGLPNSGGDGGMRWAIDMAAARTNPAGSGQAATYDGTPVSLSFYLTSVYAGTWMSESPTFVKRVWNEAYVAGHEIANHTHDHAHGEAFSAAEWDTQIQQCSDWITKPFDANEPDTSPDDSKGVGVAAADLVGFRTPFLEYNDATLQALDGLDFWYDCSIEEGWQSDQDGTDFNWPFTLDNGSPGHDVLVDWGQKEPISNYPGMWEMPVHPVIIPPDNKCAEYGVPVGLRSKLKALHSWFDDESGKLTGFDYNLWALFKMTKAEVVATLKYTLDLRLQGNRAPFMFGVHSDYYSPKWTGAPNATDAERREAIEEFVDYALSKSDARVVSVKQILDWVRNPAAL